MELSAEGATLTDEQVPVAQAMFAEILKRLNRLDGSIDEARVCRIEVLPPVEGAAHAVAVERLDDGVCLKIGAGAVEQALAGQPADLIHLLHKEMVRLNLEDSLLRHALPAGEDGLARQLLPIAHAMWLEYATNRSTLGTLPPQADLMLPHLNELLRVLPPAMVSEIAQYHLDADLDSLGQRTFGRLAHLGQVLAHVQGYLAAAGMGLDGLPEDIGRAIRTGLCAGIWGRLEQALETCWQHRDSELLAMQLRSLWPLLQQLLMSLGLRAQRGDGGALWLEVLPLAQAAQGTSH